MNRYISALIVVVACGALSVSCASADVRLPAIIDSHMVLQRDMPVPIWGWADPGEKVTISFDEHTVSSVADDTGNWRVSLPALRADGRPHSMTISATNKIELNDILIGDVWVGSGQSNMEWSLANTQNAKDAIAEANHKTIRLIHVPKIQSKTPAQDVKAKWKACTSETIPNFSAVLYYFGRKLNEEVDVPIGLVNSSWGGSPIEPWTIANGTSGGMYNGMIAPLQPFAIRGVIWYQGETNVIQKNGLAYFDRMKSLIYGWRKSWGIDMPFYFVQIAPWAGARYVPGELPALWEAQTASLKIPKTGMAVTTDLVDNIKDIHPRNKLDVGNRLALWALAKTYRQTGVVYSGPMYQWARSKGGSIELSFAHAAGLKSKDGKPLTEFKIAGSDGKFVDATAVIKGEVVVVSSDAVPSPVHVRFGWHKLANPNLVNGAGLPASPFQTNEWTGGTGK